MRSVNKQSHSRSNFSKCRIFILTRLDGLETRIFVNVNNANEDNVTSKSIVHIPELQNGLGHGYVSVR